jgi:RNA polymerase sigma factor (TIGR02999 family)
MPDPSLLEAFLTPADSPSIVEHDPDEFTSPCPKTSHCLYTCQRALQSARAGGGFLGDGGMDQTHEVTLLLDQVRIGQRDAADRLLEIVYDDLRALARGQLKRQSPGHTFHPTDLVHEVYLRLIGPAVGVPSNRQHFLAVASKAMRCVLIDHARGKHSDKRGGRDWVRVELDGIVIESASSGVDLVALDDALTRLEAQNSQRVQIVELRFFGGLTVDETAQVIGISPATVKREWAAARVWLFRELGGASGSDQ